MGDQDRALRPSLETALLTRRCLQLARECNRATDSHMRLVRLWLVVICLWASACSSEAANTLQSQQHASNLADDMRWKRQQLSAAKDTAVYGIDRRGVFRSPNTLGANSIYHHYFSESTPLFRFDNVDYSLIFLNPPMFVRRDELGVPAQPHVDDLVVPKYSWRHCPELTLHDNRLVPTGSMLREGNLLGSRGFALLLQGQRAGFASSACIGEHTVVASALARLRAELEPVASASILGRVSDDGTLTELKGTFPLGWNRQDVLTWIARFKSAKYLLVAMDRYGVPKFGVKATPQAAGGGYWAVGHQAGLGDLPEYQATAQSFQGAIEVEVSVVEGFAHLGRDEILRRLFAEIASVMHELGHFIGTLTPKGHSDLLINRPPPVDKPPLIDAAGTALIRKLAAQHKLAFEDLYRGARHFVTEVQMQAFTIDVLREYKGDSTFIKDIFGPEAVTEFLAFLESITRDKGSFQFDHADLFWDLAKIDPDDIKQLLPVHRWRDSSLPEFWYLSSASP
jgi:hypothetical protein